MTNKNPWKLYDPNGHKDDRPVRCQNCGWTGRENDVYQTVWQISSLLDRVMPGEIMPVGTCPADDEITGLCESLVHYDDVEIRYRELDGAASLCDD